MVCDKIKQIRLDNKMTQVDLAKKLDVTRSSVNAWEMGISLPSTQTLVELAKLFKVSVDYILELDRGMKIEVGHLDEHQRGMIFNQIKQFEKYNQAIELLNLNTDDPRIDDFLFEIKKENHVYEVGNPLYRHGKPTKKKTKK